MEKKTQVDIQSAVRCRLNNDRKMMRVWALAWRKSRWLAKRRAARMEQLSTLTR